MAETTQLFLLLQQYQINLKLFHLQTESYSAHKASDVTYDNLIELSDTLLEIILGLPNEYIKPFTNTPIHLRSLNIKEMREYTLKLIDFLDKYTWPSKSASNVAEELVGTLDKFVYLLKLK